MKRDPIPFTDKKMIVQSFVDSFKMLTPTAQVGNPVMFVTYICSVAITFYLITESIQTQFSWFNFQITLWLWFTVLFANFAQSLAESRGKAHAESLKKTKIDILARRIEREKEIKIPAADLKEGDTVLCEAGDIIPADGEIIEGIATVDESAITGESAPVIRESGGDRSAVTGGTRVISDKILIKVTSEPGKSFIDRIIHLIEVAKRQRTPSEIALSVVLSGLTIIFLMVTVSLKMFANYTEMAGRQEGLSFTTLPILISLLVCLIPTTIGALLSAIGIAGIERLVQRNVIAKSGRSVEAAGDIDLLILDKTGTITMGNRMASSFISVNSINEKEVATIAQLASLSDGTPEGRSIVVLAKENYGLRAESIETGTSSFIPFSAKTRMSGVDFRDSSGKIIRSIRKGAPKEVKKYIEGMKGTYPEELDPHIRSISEKGGTPLLVTDNDKVVGIVELKDVMKGGIKQRFIALRKMGIRTIMVTGDNPLTAAAIAAEAGVDDYFAEVTPEMKLDIIKKEQANGRLVAMTGDGTNDAPALAQADVAVAMNTGTQASREAGNMVDLDSNPTKLIDIVEIGKQLLMTRGALTTFSMANDVAKYFAIIPAIFGGLYIGENSIEGPLSMLNVMDLHSPRSAILSAVIFNALIIPCLIPLALKGVRYQAKPAEELLFRNVVLYGGGGLIAPMVGIKLIDLVISLIGVL